LIPDYWMLIVETLSWFPAQDITAEINSVPMAQYTHWIATLGLCKWSGNKNLYAISAHAWAGLQLPTCLPCSCTSFVSMTTFQWNKQTESFVVAFGNFSYISLLRCSNYRDKSAMSATFSLCVAPCFTKKQRGDSIRRGCLKYVYDNTTGFFHPHSSALRLTSAP